MLANLEEIHPDSDFEKSVVPQNRLLIFLGYHNGFITGSPTLRAKNSNNEIFNLTNSININPSAPLPEPEESSSSIVEPEESSSSIVIPEESSSSEESEISPNDDYIYYGYVEIIDNSDSDYGEYYAQNITWEQMQNNGEFQKISIEEKGW